MRPKTSFLAFCFILHCVGFSHAGTANSLDIISDDEVSPTLHSMLISMQSDLAQHCSASEGLFKDFGGKAKVANAICQHCFLRPAGKQRWESADPYAPVRAHLMPYLSDLNMVDPVYPEDKEYDVILINGSTVPVMRMYLSFLESLFTEHGVYAKKIVLLTGKRLLDPVHDSDALMFDSTLAGVPFRQDWECPEVIPTYESEAFRMLWDQMILSDALHSTEVVVIDAPEKWDARLGSYTRPTTVDTIRAWLATHPSPGKLLSISGNPFIHYQDATFRIELERQGLLNEGATLETVGPARPNITPTTIYLDTLARWLYTVYQYRTAS
jgi:hypothetical protein